MKVLLINGSPHQQGCTARALREVATSLEKNGVETVTLHMGTGHIRGCVACGNCTETKHCVFNNDVVNEAIAQLASCDGLIVGSPVYYAGANGTLTSLLDRMFYAGGTNGKYKPAAAVVSARRAGTTAALDQINKYFSISQMPIVSSCYWNMVHGNTPLEVEEDKEGLQIMRVLGDNMAWLLKSIEAGKEAGVLKPVLEKKERTNFVR